MLRHLQLTNALTFIDLETTGLNPRLDRIIEIGLLKFTPDAEEQSLELRFNPERPIPPSASAIHGILDEHVAKCPTFSECATHIAEFIDESDLAGFGIARFDLECLLLEFRRARWVFPMRGRKVVDAMQLFHRLEPRDLKAAVRRFCKVEHLRAHDAAQDAKAAAAVLEAMLAEHTDLPRTVESLHKHLNEVDVAGWFRRKGSSIVFARGKYRDISLNDVANSNPTYLFWLCDKVLPDAQWHIENALSLPLR